MEAVESPPASSILPKSQCAAAAQGVPPAPPPASCLPPHSAQSAPAASRALCYCTTSVYTVNWLLPPPARLAFALREPNPVSEPCVQHIQHLVSRPAAGDRAPHSLLFAARTSGRTRLRRPPHAVHAAVQVREAHRGAQASG